MKWKDLFDFVEEKCNFHEKEEGNNDSLTWTCYRDLRFVKEFCKKHKLNFKKIKKKLDKTGGFCDCEVLFNSVGRINGEEDLK